MATPFPIPSSYLVAALDELRLAAVTPPTTKEELRRLATLPKPWEPSSCSNGFRELIYIWLDHVVGWINEEHTWRIDHMIPICWVEHPHIVHELATVACLRWEAGYAITPAPLEVWHHETLPTFLERIIERIGTTGCPPGRHQPAPGVSRSALYRDVTADGERRRARGRDLETKLDT